MIDLIDSFHRKEKVRIKESINFYFDLATQIGNHVACVLNPKNDINPPQPYQVYPELFTEERKVIEQRKREDELASYKAKFIDFANKHNHERVK